MKDSKEGGKRRASKSRIIVEDLDGNEISRDSWSSWKPRGENTMLLLLFAGEEKKED